MSLKQQALDIIARLNAEDKRSHIQVRSRLSKQPLPLTASKIGGRPYLPEGQDVPTTADGKPLSLVAQINCSELPANDIYPPSGILQFWMSAHDYLWGMDLDDPISQKGSRVIYYPEITPPHEDVLTTPINWDDYGFPWQEDEEYALQFTAADSIPWWLYSDEDEQRFINAWNAAYPQQTIADFYDLDGLGEGEIADDILEDIEENNEELHRIGGVPIFTQNDPRDENKALRGYSVNLLTIVSDFSEEEEGEIMWGDAGTANWLITPEQLAARDFSKVLFEWACG